MEIIVATIEIYAELHIKKEQDSLNYQLLRSSSKEAKIVERIARDFLQKLSKLQIQSATVKVCVIVAHDNTEPLTTLAGVVTISDDIQLSLFDNSLE